MTDHSEASDAVGGAGRVLSVRGSQASVGFRDPDWSGPDARRPAVGTLLGIRCTGRLIVGVVTETSVQSLPIPRDEGYTVTAVIDLMGEIAEADGRFSRGVSAYPTIGDPTCGVTADVLKAVHDFNGNDSIEIGRLQGGGGLPALVDVDEMLSKHFALLGSTGVGKSSGVVVLLREILAKRPDLRVFVIDPHNEYARSFGERAQVLTPANLRLPFWLFNFEELVDALFRGRPPVAEEVEVLAEIVPIARQRYEAGHRGATESGLRKRERPVGYTVDTPVPYRLSDVIALIDDRIGRLENRAERPICSRLLGRIESVANDPRYIFMFDSANVGGDTMAEVLSQLFRLPTDGRPMTIMQLAGFPTEVVDSVVSVLGRMAFDFGMWSDGRLPLLFVCEEAHRYASADRSIGFGPTRRAISRIAKEGRKYGVFLGLITQRPAELDPTIVSQCSTLFVMRMSNDRDQELVRSAVPDAAASMLDFVPSLATREAFAFGEGVTIPTRLLFKEIAPEFLPRSEAISDAKAEFGRTVDGAFIDSIVERWRSATLASRGRAEPAKDHMAASAEEEAGDATRHLDPERRRLLKSAGLKS